MLLLAALLACSDTPVRKLSGYSDTFTVPARVQVGTPSAEGLTWEGVDATGRFEGVVLASWCPTCKELLAARAADPALAAATPNLYFLAEEADLHLQKAVGQGHMTPEQAAEAKARMAARGSVLLAPEALEGLGARALRVDEVPAKWFPYFFTCEAGECEGYAGRWW